VKTEECVQPSLSVRCVLTFMEMAERTLTRGPRCSTFSIVAARLGGERVKAMEHDAVALQDIEAIQARLSF
jgi:hypothetical protein